ncbi:TPA: hypothetical protein RFV54_001056 [Klebsiella aerogenes]|nr:hypothetical protein [Klebsiella aerogenes]
MAYSVQPTMVEDKQYDNNQYNSLGKPLQQTPLNGGVPIANDPNNDKRTAQDHKSNFIQAQSTISRLNGDKSDDSTHVGRNGFKYDLVDDSRAGQVRQAMQGYLEASLSGATPGEAAVYASKGVSNLIAIGKRQTMIQSLEDDPAGYNQQDINKYIQTGELKDLTANMGKWEIKDGYKQNDLTGETIPLGLSAADEQKYKFEQSQQNETQRHNQAMEANDATKAGFENQRIGNEKARLDFDKSQAEYKQQRDQVKDQKGYEEQNTQKQAVAVQGNQTIAIGKDILTDPDFNHAGTNWKTQIYRGVSSGIGDNIAGGMRSKQEQYNHMGTVLGNASLYLDAGNKRIFAKEMENAGKQFQPIDFEHMTREQIATAIHNNEWMISRFTQLAEASKNHEAPPNADQVDYNNQYGGNQQLPRGQQPAAKGGKNYSGLW